MLQRTIGLTTALFVLGFVANAHALQLTLDQSFGSDPASGPIVLDITAAADGSYVDIAMDVTGLSSPEFIKELYLNITDTSALTPGAIDSDGVVEQYQIADAGFKAGGDGYHDVFIQWNTNVADRLNAGDTYDIRLHGAGLSAGMFFDFGTSSNKGQFLAVVKVNATGGGEGSDWIGAVPEPGGVLLFSAGMLLVAARVRRG